MSCFPVEILMEIFKFVPRSSFHNLFLVSKDFKSAVESLVPIQNNRGIFIVFEGIDCVGKTTHSELLQQWINKELSSQKMCKGVKCEYIHSPDFKSEIGKTIKEVIDGKKEINVNTLHLLFVADRNQKQLITTFYFKN